MKEQLLALYELQSIDVKISQINTRLAAMDGAKALRIKYSAAKSAFVKAEKELSDLEIELKDSELKLKSIDEKRNSFEKRLYGGSINNPKELAAVEKEIAMLKGQQGNLDGRTLELYDLVEAARSKAKSAGDLTSEVEKEARIAIAKEIREKKNLEAELADLTSKRADSASQIVDRSLMTRYEAIRKKNGTTSVAKVIEGKCEGCHVTVTIFTIRELMKNKEFHMCESCGRILLLDMS